LFLPFCRASELQVTAKVCYVKYDDSTSVGVALHLTNTVFIDRALVVIPVMEGQCFVLLKYTVVLMISFYTPEDMSYVMMLSGQYIDNLYFEN
jgi:hypothetical protein